MSRFEGKVAVVTGGGTGIGLATAEQFIEQGAKVVVTGRREEPLEKLKERFPESVEYISADVTTVEGQKAIVNFAKEKFGGIDVLVNNAGAHIMKPLSDTSQDEISQLYSVNVFAPLGLTRAALPLLSKRKGSVVNVSSVVGQAAMANNSVYGSTKAAVDYATRSLAMELGPEGVRVNAVAPGLTRTPMAEPFLNDEQMVGMMVGMTPMGRLGEPGEVAQAIAYLASSDAGWVTGQILKSSGGLLV